MKNKIIYIIVTLTLLPGVLNAQKISEKCVYFFDRLENKSPWIVSENAAGLVFNNALNFSNIRSYYGTQEGNYRNFNEPESYQNFGVETKSYVRVKNIYFYGRFNYDYGIKQNQSWLGTIYPESTFNPILDSIPGKVLREDYLLSGKIGYSLSDRISLGLLFDYHTSTGAKRTDARNSNTMSKFVISPGIAYNKGAIKAGINFNYGHYVERVNYEFIGELSGKALYYMEGLFFNTRVGITNTTLTNRGYFKDVFGSAVQLEFSKSKVKFYNQLKANYNTENDFEEGGLSKRYATVDGLKIDYNGLLTFKGKKIDHNLYLNFISDEQFAYNVVNNYELIPEEINTWTFFEYGKTLRYMQIMQRYSAEYKGYLRREGDMSHSWIATLGISKTSMKKDYKIYPAKYHQDYTNTEIYAVLDKNIWIKRSGMIDMNITGSYINGEGVLLEAIDPISTGALNLNNNLLNHDFAYRTADRAKIGAGIKYSHFIKPEKGTVIYGGVNYTRQFLVNEGNLAVILNGVLPGTFKSVLSVNIGVNF